MNQQDKLNASMKWLRHVNNPRAEEEEKRKKFEEIPPEPEKDSGDIPDEMDLPTPEELKKDADRMPLEKGDLKAMIFAALTTIVPVCLLVLLALCGLIWLLFFH